MAATPLTKPRQNFPRKAVKREKRPLAAVAVFKNGLAAVKAGYYQPASGDPDEVVVGRFYESVSNVGGAAGAKSADVDFFRERLVVLLDNDADALIVAADRELTCSILDDHTATKFAASRGVGGVVYDVTSEGVWVELVFPASPDDAGLPRIQRGRTTLIAGAKPVTGVVLTATSRIFMSMADPGAGAITGFAGFHAPDASRNVGAGSFLINAIDDSKAVIATAVCTVDYLIVG